MMLKEFNSFADLQRNFGKCLILYQNKLYTTTPTVSLKLFLSPVEETGLIGDNIIELELNKKKDVLLKTPKTGWMRYGETPTFVFRNCKKQFQFGLSPLNTEYAVLKTGKISQMGYLHERVLYSKEFLLSLLSKSSMYKSGIPNQVLNMKYAIFDNIVYRELEKIGDIASNGVCYLLELYSDSLTRNDLKLLGVSLG